MSRLRQAFRLTETPAHNPVYRNYVAHVGNQPAGEMLLDMSKPIPQVAWSLLEQPFQGTGLGKKLYGEVMKRMPDGALASDPSVTSPEAARVWQGMGRRGYAVEQQHGHTVTPEAIQKAPGTEGLPTFRAQLPQFAKLARLLTPLKEHQDRVADKMSDPDQPGLVVVHGLGSGKTLTSLAVADRLGLPADVVVPAALQGNYQKEIDKHTVGGPPLNIQSLENVARKGPQTLRNPLLIVDEAHRLRNPGKTRQTLLANEAQKRLALTGSLVYNRPADMAAPINFAAGSNVLPLNQSEFEGRYQRERYVSPGFWGELTGKAGKHVMEVNPKHKKELQGLLKRYVDYHPGSTEGFPQRQEQVVRVNMSGAQRALYDKVMRDLPPHLREKVMKGLPPTKQEAAQLNSFLVGVRQISNTTAPYVENGDVHQPKIDRAVQDLQSMLEKNPRTKALVYSNFLDAGINPYKQRLEKAGIPFGEFTGEMDKRVRDQLVRDYNEDKIKALLVSSAGGEGLDLKGTRLIQLLDPHWNEEKLKQVIGRGIRFKSHDHLPEQERNVLIQRYLATRPRSGLMERMHLSDPGNSVDEYLHNMGKEKEDLNRQFMDLLKQGSEMAKLTERIRAIA